MLVCSRAALVFATLLLVVGCAEPASEPAPAADLASDTEAASSSPKVVPKFREVAAEVGLAFTHFSGTTGDYLFAEILGSGVALLDYDNDDDLDVFLVQSQLLDPAKSMGDALFPLPAEQPAGNRLFQNQLSQTGALAFIDVTDQAGVALDEYGMGVATGDIDNDGDVDLYVTNYGRNRLYRNNGDGTFADITEASGTGAPNWSTSASFFDLENDGDLDLYVTAYVEYSLDIDIRCASANGNRDYCGPQNYQNARDYLLRNDGQGTFTDVSEAYGVAEARGPGLGVAAADFNADGWTDLFVANDGEANFVWMNLEGQQFAEEGLMSGTAYNRDGSAEASMGVSAGDFDGDGDEDLFMTHLINETNTLYVNDGRGNFDDITDRAGLGSGSKAFTGFGTAWFDPDNDGWLDLYVANGDVKIEEQRDAQGDYAFDQPNQLFLNRNGQRFDVWQSAQDPATALSEISRGVAFGDIDRDGDIDMLVTNNSGPVRLLLNETAGPNGSVALKLVGRDSPRSGDGARVRVTDTLGIVRWRRVHADGSYLSASDRTLLVGIGEADAVREVAVAWPSGLREVFVRKLERGARVTLTEGSGDPWP